MTFNEYIDYAKTHIQEFLPPEYIGAEIRVENIQKMNEQYTGLIVKPEGRESVPVANLDMFYENYLQNEDIDNSLRNISNMLQTAIPPEINDAILKDYDQMKEKLFVRLSPAAESADIAANSPSRTEGDMLMTYHIFVESQDGGFMSARITNEIAKDLGLDMKQLHKDALANTAVLMPAKVQSMMAALTGIDEENPAMLVVTNELGTFGAGALFCEGVMDQVAERFNGNYFLLPSSVHEWIAVPDDGRFEIADLENMVRSANRTVVDPADRLSDNVFHYDAQEKLFERADAYEARTAEKVADRPVERGSLLGKLQDKKEHLEIGEQAGKGIHRQPGLAI